MGSGEKVNLFEGSANELPSSVKPKMNNLSSLYQMVASADAEMAAEFKKRDDELVIYTNLAENPKDVHAEVGRITLFSKLAYGLRKAGEAHAWALVHKKIALASKKEAESIAVLEEFGGWLKEKRLKEKDFKATADVRKSYAYLSETVKSASRYEAVAEGMAAHFGTLHHALGQSISTLRAVIYGPKDSSKMGYQPGTGNEG